MTARRVLVRGKVQGVWFRAFTRDEAGRLGLSGFVRNLRDGSVEAIFAGEAGAVETLIATMRRGPPRARVDALEVADAPAPAGTGFRIAPDA